MFLVAASFVETTRIIDLDVATSVAMSRMEAVRLSVSLGRGDGMYLLHPTNDSLAAVMTVKPLAVGGLRKLVCYYHCNGYSM